MALSDGVNSVNGEMGRIVSTTAGFLICQLILIMSALKTKSYNLNFIIAFIVIFVCVCALIGLVVGPFYTTVMDNDTMYWALLSLFSSGLVVGILFAMGVIKITPNTVAIVGMMDLPKEDKAWTSLLSTSKITTSAQCDPRELERLYTVEGVRFFIGMPSPFDVRAAEKFMTSHQDCIFLLTSMTDLGVSSTSPNVFRLTPNFEDILTVYKDFSSRKICFVVDDPEAIIVKDAIIDVKSMDVEIATDWPSAEQFAQCDIFFTIAHPDTYWESKADAVVPEGASLFLHQISEYAVPSPFMQKLWMKWGMKALATQSESLAGFPSKLNAVLVEGLRIMNDISLRLDDMRSASDITTHILSSRTGYAFNKAGARSFTGVAIMKFQDNRWENVRSLRQR